MVCFLLGTTGQMRLVDENENQIKRVVGVHTNAVNYVKDEEPVMFDSIRLLSKITCYILTMRYVIYNI
jgi:hypothetical protein